MGKTREPFKKIRDTKGRFHTQMGSKQYSNCTNLTEAEDIKKWWQGYTELYKKDRHHQNNHDDLEPDSLKCKVKWALVKQETDRTGSILGWTVDFELYAQCLWK